MQKMNKKIYFKKNKNYVDAVSVSLFNDYSGKQSI